VKWSMFGPAPIAQFFWAAPCGARPKNWRSEPGRTWTISPMGFGPQHCKSGPTPAFASVEPRFAPHTDALAAKSSTLAEEFALAFGRLWPKQPSGGGGRRSKCLSVEVNSHRNRHASREMLLPSADCGRRSLEKSHAPP